jgi:hypothetical protein
VNLHFLIPLLHAFVTSRNPPHGDGSYDSTFLITSLEIHAFLNKITAQGWLYGSVRYGCYIYCGLESVGVFICSGLSTAKEIEEKSKSGRFFLPHFYIYIYIYIVSGSLIECIIIKLFDPIKIIN